MRFDAKKFFALSVVILQLMPMVEAAGQSKESSPHAEAMSVWRARRVLAASAGYLLVQIKRNAWQPIDRKNLRVSSSTFEFDGWPADKDNGGKHHYVIRFADVAGISASCRGWQCMVEGAGEGALLHNEAGKPLTRLFFNDPKTSECSETCRQVAIDVAVALNRLQAFASAGEDGWQEFHRQATAWRALTTKPALPEEVRLQRLLAEDALKKKAPEEALNHYENGLNVHPTWPQGWFNAALIAAELGLHADAVEDMQAYLELVPDAQDAQAARDQIAIWQYRGGQHPVEPKPR